MAGAPDADCTPTAAIERNADRLYAAAEALGRASDAVDRLTEDDIDGHEWPVLDAVTTVNELADLLLGLADGADIRG